MEKSCFSDSQIIAILKKAEGGTSVPELCREHGISSATLYKWRSKFGGMNASLMARLKELKDENRRLKKRYAEERLKAEIVKEALENNVVKPAHRRGMAQRAVHDKHAAVRVAWAAFGIGETCYRYQAKMSAENDEMADHLIRLTHNQRSRGFGLPFGVWACEHAGLRQLSGDTLTSLKQRGIIEPKFIDRVLNELLPEHPGYYGELVWILMMMELWMSRSSSSGQ